MITWNEGRIAYLFQATSHNHPILDLWESTPFSHVRKHITNYLGYQPEVVEVTEEQVTRKKKCYQGRLGESGNPTWQKQRHARRFCGGLQPTKHTTVRPALFFQRQVLCSLQAASHATVLSPSPLPPLSLPSPAPTLPLFLPEVGPSLTKRKPTTTTTDGRSDPSPDFWCGGNNSAALQDNVFQHSGQKRTDLGRWPSGAQSRASLLTSACTSQRTRQDRLPP